MATHQLAKAPGRAGPKSATTKSKSSNVPSRGAKQQALATSQTHLIAADAFAPNAKARALLAGVKQAETDLRLGGGAFTLDEVLALLRISRQAVHNKVQDGSLFVVKGPGGRLLFPTLQFTEDGPVHGLKQLIAAFSRRSRWMLLNFLVHPNALLSGATPIAVLKRGDINLAVQAARSLDEQGPLHARVRRVWNRRALE
jgi:hypothetical protein